MRNVSRVTMWISLCGLLAGAASAGADDAEAVSGEQWCELPTNAAGPLVRVWQCRQGHAGGWTYIITHGIGGTTSDDRFHRLATAICRNIPQANVILVDWSKVASVTTSGFPNPWKVAGSIDAVGDQAAAVLQQTSLDPARTTFIGESFGNWVNARIARQFGGVHGIMALNPATAAAGYSPPNLRRSAQIAWSFHTYSAYDTNREIAHADFLLQTPADACHLQQHLWGIQWLADRVEEGDTSWLQFNKPLPSRKAAHYRALARMDGELAQQHFPREQPLPAAEPDGGRDLAVSGFVAATP
jgi:hypothetical protein